jgi:hypothetical protein
MSNEFAIAALKAEIRRLENLLDRLMGNVRLDILNPAGAIEMSDNFLMQKLEKDHSVDEKTLRSHLDNIRKARQGIEGGARYVLQEYRDFKSKGGGPGKEPPDIGRPVKPKKGPPAQSASAEEEIPEQPE